MLAALAPFLVPAAIGAVGGGIQAASQGKNPLEIGTAGLIGAGLGAGGGALGRMAGTALAGTPLAAKFAPSLYRTADSLPSWLTGINRFASDPATQARLGRRAIANATSGLVGTGLSLATPAIAAGLAGAPGAALQAAGGGARNVAGAGLTAAGAAGLPGFGAANTPGVYPFENQALPQGLDPTFGAGQTYGSVADVVNPAGRMAASRIAQEMEADTQVRNMQVQAAAMTPWIEGAKKAELARQLYAATVRGNLATQQNLLVGGINTARQMGLNAASQMGNALSAQYQYS